MMAADKNAKRRKYSAELKAQVVNECEAPGASVARVAMVVGVNYPDRSATTILAGGSGE